MNKTFTINLNGKVYNINDDAYESLKAYLENLRKHFDGEEGANEIMEDIEARIGELFTERMRYGMQVVGQNDVNDVIAIMGNPEEIDEGEPMIPTDEEKSEGKKEDVGCDGETETQAQQQPTRKSKRLFRDPDDVIIAGVCSGLGAYFNVDPWGFRALFLVMCFLSLGSPVLIYVILWILIPEAKTVAQKLQMRGEAANVENIRNAINEGETVGSSRQSALSEVLGFVVKFFAVLFGGCLGLLILFILLTIGLASIPFFMPGMHMGPMPMMPGNFSINIVGNPLPMLLASIAVVGIPIYKLMSEIFIRRNNKKPLSPAINWTLLGIWIVALIIVLKNFI